MSRYEFSPEMIVSGTMCKTNKTEISYSDIQHFIKNLYEKAKNENSSCLVLFSVNYLRKMAEDYKNIFYVGESFIALNKPYDLSYLKRNFLAYQSEKALTVMGLINKNENNSFVHNF